jgi:hypothetical protein
MPKLANLNDMGRFELNSRKGSRRFFLTARRRLPLENGNDYVIDEFRSPPPRRGCTNTVLGRAVVTLPKAVFGVRVATAELVMPL